MKVVVLLLSWVLTGALFASQLKIMTEDIPPFNYIEDGKLKGIGADLVQEIMKRLHIEAEIEVLPWARAYQTTLIKDECVLFSTSRTDARENLFKWVGPLTTSDVFFYKRSDSKIKVKSLEDTMMVESVGVHKNDVSHQIMVLKGYDNLDVSPKFESAFHKLIVGRIDLLPSSIHVAKNMMEKIGKDYSEIENTGISLFRQHLYIAFSKNTPDFEVARWQKALDAIKQEGLYKKIYETYIK